MPTHKNLDSGFVKLHRSIMDWEWYTTPNMFLLFLHLIIKANHKPAQWCGRTIERGQAVIGRESLSFETGISAQSCRTCIKRLKSTNEITTESTNKFTVVTITNYERYQMRDSGSNQQYNQPANKQLTNNQPTTNHKQEYKEEKEYIKDIVEQARPILDHLNERAKTTFKPDTTITCRLIGKLLKRGYTQKDFEAVHNRKVEQWINDEKMRKFIRPQTLYAESNFEAYLNEKPAATVSRIAKL